MLANRTGATSTPYRHSTARDAWHKEGAAGRAGMLQHAVRYGLPRRMSSEALKAAAMRPVTRSATRGTRAITRAGPR